MYIAMNRFKVFLGQEERFEDIWRSRNSLLDQVDGFIEFNLLRGPSNEEITLYASHTKWKSKLHFESWTKSSAFRTAHKDTSHNKNLYNGHPKFEGFECVLQ